VGDGEAEGHGRMSGRCGACGAVACGRSTTPSTRPPTGPSATTGKPWWLVEPNSSTTRPTCARVDEDQSMSSAAPPPAPPA
jgi:hypothetical protein